MPMVKGDQYVIPIQIKKGNTIITPQNCTDVRIQIGSVLKEYSKQQLTFNSTTNCWQFSLSENETFLFSSATKYQVGVKTGTEFLYSTTGQFTVNANIIERNWAV